MTGPAAMKVDLNLSRAKSKKKSLSAKEQEVPFSVQSNNQSSTGNSLDDSSSLPSSPSASSSVMDDVVMSPVLSLPTLLAQASEKPASGRKKKTVALTNGAGGGETTKRSTLHGSLLQKAKAAMSSLVPLFDKLPQDVAFGDDVLASVKAAAFTAFCVSGVGKAPLYMQPSEVLVRLDDFTRRGQPSSSSANNHAGGLFKRPHSPHSGRAGEGSQSSNQKRAKSAAAISSGPPAAESSSVSSADLKERLQAKLLAFRVKRKATMDPTEAATFHDLKRKLHKLKKKEKNRAKKSANKQAKPMQNGSPGGGSQLNGDGTGSSRSSSVVSEEGKMIFSRFDFFDSSASSSGEGAEKKHPKQPVGKNLAHLINKAEADKRKLARLEETDETKAAAVKEKIAWKEALLKAQGVKLKNDPVKLKHALKEQTKRKEKSAKKWAERANTIQQGQKQKQDKRDTNIQARKDRRKDKKRKRGIKKGHIIPGFN